MVMRGVSLNILLSHLLIAGAGSTCVPVQCLRCNATGATQADPCELCSNYSAQCIDEPSDIPSNCKKDFQVSVNSTGSQLVEGDDIDLACAHNLPNLTLTFGWKRNREEIQEGKNKSKLSYKNVSPHEAGLYVCFMDGSCGCYESPPHDVTVKNQSMVILVICGVSAFVLMVVIGLAVHFKQKRDNASLRERMKQKTQLQQTSDPISFIPK